MLCFNWLKCKFVNIMVLFDWFYLIVLHTWYKHEAEWDATKKDENTKKVLFQSLTKIPLTLNILHWKSGLKVIIPDGHKSD